MRRAKSLVATACCLSVVFFLTLHKFILIHRPVDDPHGLRYGYMGFPLYDAEDGGSDADPDSVP